MGDLTRDFDRREFACKCGCGFDGISPTLVALVQEIRDEVGKPVYIESGCRCPRHNKAIGGVRNSAHLAGEAADIRVEGMRSYYLFRLIRKMHEGGKIQNLTYCYRPGVYSVHVGVDVKPRTRIFAS